VGRVGREPDFVKVLDFGLVKPIERGNGDDSLATMAGMTLGTPAYMAPEMIQSETIDGRADLYSLGCVAYFLLTGQLVFQGDTAIQTMFMHIQQPPVPPSQRTDNPIPPALEEIILACLAKQPSDRPQSAADLAADLTAIEERRALR
jgi:eukaryotic-like serine/threonine-protein kinase